MRTTVPYSVNEDTITCVINGTVQTVQRSNAQAQTIMRGLADGASPSELLEMFDQAKAVKHFMAGNVEISGNAILYRGQPVHNVVADRILQFMREGGPYQPLVNFLDKLMLNPSARSVEQLYAFLEKYSMAITPAGTFLAYKAITGDWKDKHTRSIDNHIGQVVRMSRNLVDDDPASACSRGLHVGSMEYVGGFAGSGDKIIIVEVNPANVVSVPHDCSQQKIRCCEYRVVDEYQGLITKAYVANSDRPYDEDETGAESDVWDEAYSEGRDEGYSEGKDEGYDEGYTAGIEAARDALKAQIDEIV